MIQFLILFLFVAGFAAAECKPLDKKHLDEILIPSNIDLYPGNSYQYKPFIRECCVFETEVKDVCATWTIAPTKGVQLDANTGALTIDKSVPPGTSYTVTANIDNGRKKLTGTISVFTLEQNPLVGLWREAAQIECGSGKEVKPQMLIEEIEFTADGRFTVTWLPFEVYKDYWGTYFFDKAKGIFRMSGLAGNYVPTDVDNAGTFLMQPDHSLILKDVWLGTPHENPDTPPAKKACGHRLVPYGSPR